MVNLPSISKLLHSQIAGLPDLVPYRFRANREEGHLSMKDY